MDADYTNGGEPIIKLEIDGQEHLATWFNTCVYTHLKRYAQLDHIFISQDQEPESEGADRAIGHYIFRQVVENFDDIIDGLDEYNFPHLHKPYPSETDMRVYIQAAEKDLDKADEIAAYWEKEYGL